MSTKFCPQCGEEVLIEASFCQGCGFQLQKTVIAAVPAIAYPNHADNGSATMIQQNIIPVATVNVQQSPVQKKVQYAEFGPRFLAFIIDMIFVQIICGVFYALAPYASDEAIAGINAIVAFFYFWIFESMGNGHGKTLGKHVMKIRTVDENTYGNITPMQALLHVIGKAFFLIIDLIIGVLVRDHEDNDITNPDKCQIRISQRLSHTVVIKDN